MTSAATCPSCERPWSEHTKGLPGFVPICPPRPASAASRPENKLAVALAVREAMREHRKGKPIAFQAQSRPLDKDGWPARWSDPTYLGDGPWGA